MIAKYKQTRKSSGQNIFFSVLLGSLISIIIGFLLVSNFRISKKRAALDSQINRLKEEIIATQEKKRQLEAHLYQSTQKEYLEKEARETFNLKKPGEEVVTILPSEENPRHKEEAKQWWNPFNW